MKRAAYTYKIHLKTKSTDFVSYNVTCSELFVIITRVHIYVCMNATFGYVG